MAEERGFSFREALVRSGLQEARFRYLEKEFGAFLGFSAPFFLNTAYTARQVAALRKIESIVQSGDFTLELIKEKICKYLATRREGMWTIAVTSGKGGVGKTSLTVNLAVALGRSGIRPAVVDADLGLANVHLFLGLLPQRDLGDLVRGAAGMDEILIRDVHGISLVPGSSGMTELANLDRERREYLAGELRKLYYYADTIVIDTGSGISENVVRFLSLADEIVVVVTPNIASCMDALGVIRAAAARSCEGNMNLVVNRCRDEAQAREIHARLRDSARRLTGRAIRYAGHVPEDPHVEQAIEEGVPLICRFPTCRASRQVRQTAGILLEERRTAAGEAKDRFVKLFGDEAGALAPRQLVWPVPQGGTATRGPSHMKEVR